MKTVKKHHGGEEVTFERFAPRGRSQHNLNNIKNRVSQDIVEMTKRKGGSIDAGSIEAAVDLLSAWLKRHSKRLIEATFRNLVDNHVFRYNDQKSCYVFVAI